MARLSRQFQDAIRLSKIPAYGLALSVGKDPARFYKELCGAAKADPEDVLIVKIGLRLGLPAGKIFISDDEFVQERGW
ncbi:hypothetical protein ACFL4G_09015 [Thermodesulfobacteriota bacterium]